jgi:hypothetical protein
MAVTRERLRALLGSQASLEQWFIIRALEHIMDTVDPGSVNELLDELIPSAPVAQALYFGRPLSFYSGLSRTRMKAADIGLTDAQVDAIFTALGIVSGMGASNPMAVEVATEKGMFQESELQSMKAVGSEDGLNDGVVETVLDQPENTTVAAEDGQETQTDEAPKVSAVEATDDSEQVTEGGGSDESSVDTRKGGKRKGK